MLAAQEAGDVRLQAALMWLSGRLTVVGGFLCMSQNTVLHFSWLLIYIVFLDIQLNVPSKKVGP